MKQEIKKLNVFKRIKCFSTDDDSFKNNLFILTCFYFFRFIMVNNTHFSNSGSCLINSIFLATNFQAYFSEALKVKKLSFKLSVIGQKFQQLSSYFYYILDGESLSDCVVFIYHLHSILKFENTVFTILHIFIFNVC